MSTLLESLKPQFTSQQTWKEQRMQAWEQVEKLGLPTVKHEEWKYTNLQNLSSVKFAPTSSQKADLNSIPLYKGFAAYKLVLVNGIVVENTLPFTLSVKKLSECDKATQDAFWSAPSHAKADVLTQLNMATCPDPLVLLVAAGKSIDKPVHILHVIDSSEAEVFTANRLLIKLEKAAQITVAETYTFSGKNTSFSSDYTLAILEQDAVFNYYKIQEGEGESTHVGSTEIIHNGKSLSNSLTVTLGGATTRNNLNLVFNAEYCEAHMYGLYMTGDEQHVDNHTIADHAMPNCYSNELYKGVLDGESTGVFNGKIFVRQDAQKTNAFQSNKNVLLSKDASVNTKPQLEIFADDVKCSHGATTGQLDETALFYMRSRGIGEDTARVLLMQAFANDILEKIASEDLRSYMFLAIEKRLSR